MDELVMGLVNELERLRGAYDCFQPQIEDPSDEHGPMILVVPDEDSRSAPVTIHLERDDLVSITIGEAAQVELYDKQGVMYLMGEILAWITAVLDGDFVEVIHRRHGRVVGSRLNLVVDGVTQAVTYREGLFPLVGTQREKRHYAPCHRSNSPR